MPTPDAAAAVRSLSPFLTDWIAFQRWYRQVPAICVGISVGEETVHLAGHGVADLATASPATPSTRFRVASHSKLFTATAIMQLHERGALDIDGPVRDLLGEEWTTLGDTPITPAVLEASDPSFTRVSNRTRTVRGEVPSSTSAACKAG